MDLIRFSKVVQKISADQIEGVEHTLGDAIRVLHVFGLMNTGGAENRIMDIYRNINRNKVQFDFLVHTDKKCFYDDEIRSLGGRIYSLPRLTAKTILPYLKAVNNFFKEHKEYDIIHGHISSTGAIYHFFARKYGVKVRIAHARSTRPGEGGAIDLIKYLLTIPIRCLATHKFAVSAKAGRSQFGAYCTRKGQVKVIPNAIDVDKFSYDYQKRIEKRKELNLENKFVIGHVGRFTKAKNHGFLLDIFFELYKLNNNCTLLLIGYGELFEKVSNKVKKLGLEKAVVYFTNCNDTSEYLNAMDIFVFPSRFEGMPGTLIEAQTSGLNCFVSDRITAEAAITPLVHFLPLNVSPRKWAYRIIEQTCSSYEVRHSWAAEISELGYAAKRQAKLLEEFYLSCI